MCLTLSIEYEFSPQAVFSDNNKLSPMKSVYNFSTGSRLGLLQEMKFITIDKFAGRSILDSLTNNYILALSLS